MPHSAVVAVSHRVVSANHIFFEWGQIWLTSYMIATCQFSSMSWLLALYHHRQMIMDLIQVVQMFPVLSKWEVDTAPTRAVNFAPASAENVPALKPSLSSTLPMPSVLQVQKMITALAVILMPQMQIALRVLTGSRPTLTSMLVKQNSTSHSP